MSFERRGFTLLEVMVALGVIALAAAIVLPRLGDGGATAVEVAARRIADAANYGRERAILGGTPMRLVVDLDGGRWEVGRPAREATRVERDASRPDALPAGVRVRAVARGETDVARGGVAVLDFDPAGDALPARLDLADGRGHAARVLLPPAGARAVVER